MHIGMQHKTLFTADYYSKPPVIHRWFAVAIDFLRTAEVHVLAMAYHLHLCVRKTF